MRRLIPAIILILFVPGCATDGTTGQAADDADRIAMPGLESWIGATDRELVLNWGAPDAIYELADGSRVLTWRSIFAGPAATDDQPGATRPIRYECITNIDIGPDGTIRDYAVQGNGCPGEPE